MVGGKLELDTDTFEQLKPGLSSFADEPAAGAESLDPLLAVAMSTVPQELQVGTLYFVRQHPCTTIQATASRNSLWISL